ncbi:DsrE family protein [Dongia deserti]|uniref:DsrE family protein n=1 Tax=Dongia deserti TaxID=2268030 RepID=UPI000E65BC3C|nr:DsrE family protein [Dongia deserti]
MADYLLIESRDPFESAEVGGFLDLAEGLAKEGSGVTLFLVQNAVMTARHGARPTVPHNGRVLSLAALATNGVRVLADSFSLQERGISPNRLIAGVTVAPLSAVVDQMAAGCKALWH